MAEDRQPVPPRKDIGDQNKMLIDRIKGVPAKPDDGTVPGNPNRTPAE